MSKPRLLYSIVFAVLAATAALPACAALHMNVTVAGKTQPKPGVDVAPDRTAETEVVLADSYISRRTGNTTVVYDFSRRRRYVIDETSKTYDDYALYDVVGFREVELRNRDSLRKMAASAQANGEMSGKLSTELEDEHELAVRRATARTIDVRTEGADEVFASGGVNLLSHGKNATPVTPADAVRFVQYLRYSFSGHPDVLAALQKEGQIPAHLVYTFQPAWGTGTIDLTIGDVRPVDAPAMFTLAGYTPRPPAGDAVTLEETIDHAWATRSTLAAQAIQAARAPAEMLDAQLRAQRPLDTYLAVTELQLSGAPVPPVSDEQRRALQTDPDLQKLAQALAAKTPDDLHQAVAAFQALRTQAGAQRYLLRLFEANAHLSLRDPPATVGALYLDVLRANPALAGAYKDIGDFYFRRFDTQRAWRSWEIARTLAPLWPNLDGIANLERALAGRFPEYFEMPASAQ